MPDKYIPELEAASSDSLAPSQKRFLDDPRNARKEINASGYLTADCGERKTVVYWRPPDGRPTRVWSEAQENR
jgi:hypothetical protein